MRDERRLNAEERELAETMARLRPIRPGLSRDAILLETYRRAARRQAWLWRGVAAALAAGLALSVVLRPPPRTVEKVVYVQPKPTSQEPPAESMPLSTRIDEPPPPASQPYLALRYDVLAWGMTALPRGSPARAVAPPAALPSMLAPEQSTPPYDLLKPFGIGGRS
jgi:hypothetical protein